jgi:hypothetical protein
VKTSEKAASPGHNNTSRRGEGLRNDLESLRTGLLGKDIKNCSWGEKGHRHNYR